MQEACKQQHHRQWQYGRIQNGRHAHGTTTLKHARMHLLCLVCSMSHASLLLLCSFLPLFASPQLCARHVWCAHAGSYPAHVSLPAHVILHTSFCTCFSAHFALFNNLSHWGTTRMQETHLPLSRIFPQKMPWTRQLPKHPASTCGTLRASLPWHPYAGTLCAPALVRFAPLHWYALHPYTGTLCTRTLVRSSSSYPMEFACLVHNAISSLSFLFRFLCQWREWANQGQPCTAADARTCGGAQAHRHPDRRLPRGADRHGARGGQRHTDGRVPRPPAHAHLCAAEDGHRRHDADRQRGK